MTKPCIASGWAAVRQGKEGEFIDVPTVRQSEAQTRAEAHERDLRFSAFGRELSVIRIVPVIVEEAMV